MIKFYFNLAPNPTKVALMLEETGLPYELVPIDTRKGEQHTPAFRAVNPNGKVPAIVDGDVTVFDSSAILLYLGEKTGKLMPPDTPAARARLLSWLMFVGTGVGPYSGQAVHFQHHAPEKLPYAIKRYRFEAERHYKILDAELAKGRYLMGDIYTIADINLWGWLRLVPMVLGEEAWAKFPNVKRRVEEVNARPAAARVAALRDKYKFKTEMDDEARRNLFPGLAQAASTSA
jgi:GST-like protein